MSRLRTSPADSTVASPAASFPERDATQIGYVTPAIAGPLGRHALVGATVDALPAGSIGDGVGRRQAMLTSCACFSAGMALTATATTITAFGGLRLGTGLGIGSLRATAAAPASERAPAKRKTLINAIT